MAGKQTATEEGMVVSQVLCFVCRSSCLKHGMLLVWRKRSILPLCIGVFFWLQHGLDGAHALPLEPVQWVGASLCLPVLQTSTMGQAGVHVAYFAFWGSVLADAGTACTGDASAGMTQHEPCLVFG
jgi:hypothetical protein